MNEKEITEILQNHEERIKKLEEKEKINVQIPTIKELSMREFFNNYQSNSENEKTLIIMYYIELYKKIEKLSVPIITQGFIDAREKVPKNIADQLQKLARKGFIMLNGEENKYALWTITNSGYRYLEGLKNE